MLGHSISQAGACPSSIPVAEVFRLNLELGDVSLSLVTWIVEERSYMLLRELCSLIKHQVLYSSISHQVGEVGA